MNIPAWHVLTWKPCFTPVSDFFRMVPGMRHLATTSYVPSEDSGRTGQCLWGGEIDGQPVGLAWDWGEALPNVPALSDPMHMLTNIYLLDGDGNCLSSEQRVLYLNQALHSLSWQPEVLAATERRAPGRGTRASAIGGAGRAGRGAVRKAAPIARPMSAGLAVSGARL